jgi:hypothetical protein
MMKNGIRTKITPRRIATVAVGLLLLSLSQPLAWAEDATLSWDPPTINMDGTPVTNLAGYRVYWGTASRDYSSVTDVGNTTTYTVAGLSTRTYYFTVTAYDTSGGESIFSNEVSKSFGDPSGSIGGGCGRISLTDGKSSGPGKAADMLGLITVLLILSVKRNIKAVKLPQISWIMNRLTSKDSFGLSYFPQQVSVLRIISTRAIAKIVFLVVFLFSSYAEAATYYVSPTGLDSNPGTLAQPWQHICYAIGGQGRIWTTDPSLITASNCSQSNPTKLNAGDTLILLSGTYKEYQIGLSTGANSGTATNPITIKPAVGVTVTIDGGWQAGGTYANATCVTGQQFDCTGGPGWTNTYGFWIDKGISYWTFQGYNTTIGDAIFKIQHQLASAWYIGADPPNTSNIVIDGMDCGNIVIMDNTSCVTLSVSAYAVTIKNSKLHVETAMETRGVGIELFSGGNNHIIENNEIYHVGAGVHYKHGEDNPGSYTSNSVLVENNYIHDLQALTGTGTGIFSTTDNMVISNNLIVNTNNGQGVWVYDEESSCNEVGANNNQIIHNTIINTGKPAIQLSAPINCHGRGATNTIVKDNLVYNTGTIDSLWVWRYWSSGTNVPTPWTSGKVYSAGVEHLVSPSVGYFNPNCCASNTSYAALFDFYNTGGTTGTTEPVWNTACPSLPCTISDGTVTWTGFNHDRHNTTLDYNLYYSTSSFPFTIYGNGYANLSSWQTATQYDPASPGYPNTGQDVHSIQNAPIFVNYAGNDFGLASGSPGKNAASDGTDMGANVCTVGARPTCLAPPGNLTVK